MQVSCNAEVRGPVQIQIHRSGHCNAGLAWLQMRVDRVWKEHDATVVRMGIAPPFEVTALPIVDRAELAIQAPEIEARRDG